MGLKEYAAKRQFGKTPEPEPPDLIGGSRLVFVVQKHAARALHYDLRLELEGVLKSWAVPRGPSLDPSLKRLAVMVEDHPLDYRDFEGVIPEGNYGAGSVIIWDRGFYRHPLAGDDDEGERLLLEGLQKGDLKFVLHGERLRGEFALVRTGKDGKSWLLLKKKDRYAAAEEILGENRSVVSAKTLEEVFAAGAGKPGQEKIGRIRLREALESGELADAPAEPMPHMIKPMLATQVADPFDEPEWLFEVKWDGYRAVAEVRDGGVALYSRNLISLERKFHPIAESLRKLGFEAVLDGEIVVVDDEGHPDFQMLQDYGKTAVGHLLYYVFDLIHFEGHDLTCLPLVRRKELLQKLLPSLPGIRFSEHVWKDGVLFFQVVREKGLEGIVAKHSQGRYRMGKRGREWLKVKTRRTQEGVIAGFTQPRGGRGHFGALVLGAFKGEELVFIGHAGSGFGMESLRKVHESLLPLVQGECPFSAKPETNTPATWVRPELVCEVEFSGWTGEGVMRHPVFLRLREDKEASEVTIEEDRPKTEG